MRLMKLEFERLPKESAKAFAAFRAYLEMGPERSLAAVAARLGKSKVMMEKWSRRHRWVERVEAHGLHLAEVERLAIESQVVEKSVEWSKMAEGVRRLAWKKGDELLALADEFLERWRKSTRVPGMEGIVRGIELAMRLKQFAAGMATEVKQVNATLTATVDVDWEVALRRAYGPKGGGSGEVVDAEVISDRRLVNGEKAAEQALPAVKEGV